MGLVAACSDAALSNAEVWRGVLCLFVRFATLRGTIIDIMLTLFSDTEGNRQQTASRAGSRNRTADNPSFALAFLGLASGFLALRRLASARNYACPPLLVPGRSPYLRGARSGTMYYRGLNN